MSTAEMSKLFDGDGSVGLVSCAKQKGNEKLSLFLPAYVLPFHTFAEACCY